MQAFTRIILAPAVVLAALGLMAYSGGMAAVGERGYTGAPSATGGNELTCGLCHNSGSFGEPQLAFLLDGVPDTTYQPGQTYRVTVAITPETGKPAGYGFQAQFLTAGESPVTAGTLSAPDTGSQVTSLTNGRVYAEHIKVNPDSLFTFDWTAPEAGTGDVRFYAAGNTVNLSSTTTGDNGSSAPLVVTLREGATTATTWQPATAGRLSVFPNPARNTATVRLEANVEESAVVTVLAPDGRVVRRESMEVTAGRNEWPIDLRGEPAGIYRVTVIGKRQRFFNRLVKQ